MCVCAHVYKDEMIAFNVRLVSYKILSADSHCTKLNSFKVHNYRSLCVYAGLLTGLWSAEIVWMSVAISWLRWYSSWLHSLVNRYCLHRFKDLHLSDVGVSSVLMVSQNCYLKEESSHWSEEETRKTICFRSLICWLFTYFPSLSTTSISTQSWGSSSSLTLNCWEMHDIVWVVNATTNSWFVVQGPTNPSIPRKHTNKESVLVKRAVVSKENLQCEWFFSRR